jgi:hypothetical protein
LPPPLDGCDCNLWANRDLNRCWRSSYSQSPRIQHPCGVVRLNPKLTRYLASEIRAGLEEVDRVAGSVQELLRSFDPQS